MKKFAAFLLCLLIFISVIPVSSAAAVSARDVSFENALASDLKSLGLFQGVSATDFDLDRAPSRVEALVMLIRVLGKESEAQNGSWQHPFTDVPAWADQYVGYAYENKLTNGVSATCFGAGTASASMYLTFALRALGYSDSGGDFTWDNPFDLADSVGILPNMVSVNNFLRADVVLVSYAALPAALKGSGQTLADKLIAAGVFTQEQYYAYYDENAIANHSSETKAGTVLTAQQIYALCSPAVFYIETYDVEGWLYGTGSGFFIEESGIAVTNYHVLENAMSARIMLTDGRAYDLEGVLAFDMEQDYAIVKINGSGFNTLVAGDSSTVQGGEIIYTIGNPLGLTNTISNGLVSNPCRADLNNMIQISAPISPGSSGGALINEYGAVIGITTLGVVGGQNLNFAVPINAVIPDEELATYEDRHGKISLPYMLAYAAYLEYQSIPAPDEDACYEIEPNDDPQAGWVYITNGTTLYGCINGDDLDLTYIYCNCPGTLNIRMRSASAWEYVDDLVLYAGLSSGTWEDVVFGTSVQYEDGAYGYYISYQIPTIGLYEIGIYSYQLYKYYNIATDYGFYTEFVPDISSYK